MTEYPITPAVAPADAAKAPENAAAPAPALTVAEVVSDAQKVAKADKAPIIAALVHVVVLLTTAFGLHLTGQDVSILGSIVTAGLSYFVAFKPKS